MDKCRILPFAPYKDAAKPADELSGMSALRGDGVRPLSARAPRAQVVNLAAARAAAEARARQSKQSVETD